MAGREIGEEDALDSNDWYSDVLQDLSRAMIRDGLYASAEALDDALLVLHGELQSMRKQQMQGRASTCEVHLRIVKD